MIELDIEKLKRRLLRAKRIYADYHKRWDGHEKQFTFYGGWDAGYLAGKISILEDILDELGIEVPELKEDNVN